MDNDYALKIYADKYDALYEALSPETKAFADAACEAFMKDRHLFGVEMAKELFMKLFEFVFLPPDKQESRKWVAEAEMKVRRDELARREKIRRLNTLN